MIEDREIWACANQLIRQHGDRASLVADQSAAQLPAAGEDEGADTFLRVADRIRSLECVTPTGSVH